MTRWHLISAALVVLVLAVALFVGFVVPDWLPERMPIHWDLHMEPDGWVERGDAWKYLLIYPGVMALTLGLMCLLPWLSPKNFEVDRFKGTFGYIFTLLIGFFGLLLALQLWAATGPGEWFGRVFVASFFVLFALLGNVMGKVQRNFWVGIRTPWTLASEAVWVRTHRQAAWLWVAASVLGALAVLVGVPFWLPFAGLMLTLLWPVLYSLLLYKRLEREGKL